MELLFRANRLGEKAATLGHKVLFCAGRMKDVYNGGSRMVGNAQLHMPGEGEREGEFSRIKRSTSLLLWPVGSVDDWERLKTLHKSCHFSLTLTNYPGCRNSH